MMSQSDPFRNDVDNLLSILDTAEEIASSAPSAFTGNQGAAVPAFDYSSILEPTPLRPDRNLSMRRDEYVMKQLLQQTQPMKIPSSREAKANNSFSDLFAEMDDTPLDLEEAILAPAIAGNMTRGFASQNSLNKGFMNNSNSLFSFAPSCVPSQPTSNSNSCFDGMFPSLAALKAPQLPNTPTRKVLSSTTPDESRSESPAAPVRFRKYQACQWEERFQELLLFRREHGHLLVPHSYPPNQKLAQWVKRQRHQFKRKKLGHHSTLTDDREAQLLEAGFIFDSHRAVWYTRFETLKAFKMANGHCTIPAKFDDGSLNVWIKHQRRQYLLFNKGEKSTMTEERIAALDSIGFDWNPRNLVRSSFKISL